MHITSQPLFMGTSLFMVQRTNFSKNSIKILGKSTPPPGGNLMAPATTELFYCSVKCITDRTYRILHMFIKPFLDQIERQPVPSDLTRKKTSSLLKVCITCSCGKVYISYSGNIISIRFNVHIRHTRN